MLWILQVLSNITSAGLHFNQSHLFQDLLKPNIASYIPEMAEQRLSLAATKEDSETEARAAKGAFHLPLERRQS